MLAAIYCGGGACHHVLIAEGSVALSPDKRKVAFVAGNPYGMKDTVIIADAMTGRLSQVYKFKHKTAGVITSYSSEWKDDKNLEISVDRTGAKDYKVKLEIEKESQKKPEPKKDKKESEKGKKKD